MDRHPLAVEVDEQLPEPRHRAAARLHQRAVSAPTTNGRLQPADLLLCDLDGIEAAAAQLLRERAELAERVAHTLEQMWVLLDHVPRAEVAAALLVGEHDEDHVAR